MRKLRSIFKLPTSAVILAVSTALTTGCQGVSENTEASQNNLYVLSTQLWNIGETIQVCWDDPNGLASSSDREGVRRGALSWAAVGNFGFSGWENACPASGFSGVKISMVTAQLFQTDGLGKSPTGIRTMTINLPADFVDTTDRCANGVVPIREDCIMETTRHEWGHVLGYAHDNNRPDTDCDRPPRGGNGDLLIGPPDINSVMSYCSGQHQLSYGDITGTIQLYTMSPVLQMSLL